MDIISRLTDRSEWLNYLNYKTEQGNLSEKDIKELSDFIDNEEYKETVETIKSGKTFSAPKKTLVAKSNASKKRAVYTFNREENYVLKLITFLLRDYDDYFAPNLYSFRKERGVKRATNDLLKIKNLQEYYVYKVDISDYFNSVDIALLKPMLYQVLKNDNALYRFLINLLECPYTEFNGEIICENKGIMAGVPISTFLANLYLSQLDFYFYNRNIPYMRYSDDIIVFAKSIDEIEEYKRVILGFLESHNLIVNHDKESTSYPHEEWTFLGFSYNRGVIDICTASFEKLKAKMRRKARALNRWAEKKGVPKEYAARAFIKRFNAKLYDNPVYSELTWTRWFFPVINTDKTLKLIDAYMIDCIRYLATGKRTKSKYDFRYEDIKRLGFRSLVNEYYKHKSEKENEGIS